MTLLFIISLAIITIGVVFHDKMSYKKMYQRQVINSKHPNWTPYCGVNFLEKDPQWFMDNGYGEYIRRKRG